MTDPAKKQLITACKEMASILNGLHLNTVIKYEQVERIRAIEKSARFAIMEAELNH